MRGRLRGMVVALGAILLTALTTAAYGQVDQGKIQGAVKDATGASIPGVSITVKNDRTGEERQTMTGDRGVTNRQIQFALRVNF